MFKLIKIVARLRLYLTILVLGLGLVSCLGSSATSGNAKTFYSSDHFPVSIPVTIAKTINGVDATTLQFEPAVDLETVLDGKTLFPNDIIGTISGEIIGPDDARIGIIVDDVYVDVIESRDLEFRYRMPNKYFGKPIAFVVLGPFSTIYNDGPSSFPVIVTIDNDPVAEDFSKTIHITNIDPFLPDQDIAINILDQQIAVSKDENAIIAFVGINNTNMPLVSTVAVEGGANTHLVEGMTFRLADIEYNSDGILYGLNSETGTLFSVESDGLVNHISSVDSNLTSRSFQIHPGGRYMAINVDKTHSNGGTSQTLKFVDLDSPSTTKELPIPNSETQLVTHMSFDWLDSSNIVIIKHFANESYSMEKYDVAAIINGSATSPSSSKTLVSSTTNYMDQPVTDRGYAGQIAYKCVTQAGTIGICLYDVDDDSNSEIVSGNFSVSSLQFAPDGLSMVFEKSVVISGITYEEITIYWFDTDEIQHLTPGKVPRYIAAKDNVLAYLSQDWEGNNQISILPYEKETASGTAAPEPTPITQVQSSPVVNTGETLTLQISGGRPPYTYEILSGNGSVDSVTGAFTAPAEGGTTVVRVTDSIDNSVDISVTVNTKPPSSTSYSQKLHPTTKSRGKIFPIEMEAQLINLNTQDEDGDSVTYEVVSQPSKGSVTATDGKIYFTPEYKQTESTTFKYRSCDSNSCSDTSTATITFSSLENSTFTEYGTILQDQTGTWMDDVNSEGINAPTVAYVASEGKYYMYFEGKIKSTIRNCGPNHWRIGVATSTDLTNWTMEKDPVIDPTKANPGDFYECATAQPSVIYDGTKFHLFFKGQNETGGGGQQYAGVGHATSTDGINFTTPVNVGFGNRNDQTTAIYVNNEIVLLGTELTGGYSETRHAMTSNNGSTWPANMTAVFSTPKQFAPGSKDWADGNLWSEVDRFWGGHGFIVDQDSNSNYNFQLFTVGQRVGGVDNNPANPARILSIIETTDFSNYTLSTELDTDVNYANGSSTNFLQGSIIRHGNNYIIFYAEFTNGTRRTIRMGHTYDNWPLSQ